MRNCKKCGDVVPWRITINGEKKLLAKRKYCLNCSPFKGRNTRQLEKSPAHGTKRVCKTCGRIYILDRSKGHRANKCNSCYLRQKHVQIKKRAVEFLGGSCLLCGYHRSTYALQFHHLSESKKEISIGNSYNRSWKTLRKELRKCALLCANCHAEFHGGVISKKDLKTACNSDR